MKNKILFSSIIFISVCFCASLGLPRALAATYYVDSSRPDDSGNGLAPETAWKNIDKVNKTSFSPGDSILFKRGGVWHGQLKPSSSGVVNKPITYAAYGSGNKPLVINGKFFPAGTTDWGKPNEFGEYSLDIGSTNEFISSSIVGVLRGQSTGVNTYKRVESATSTPGLLGDDQYTSGLVTGERIIRYKPPTGHKPSEYDWEFSKWNGTVFFGTNISWVVVDGLSFYNSYYDGHSDPADIGVVDFFGSHCTVKNSTIWFANSMGVEFAGQASQYNTLENCDIQYGRSAGVDLREGASNDTIKGNHIANNSLGATDEEVFNDRGGIVTVGEPSAPITHITVIGNVIHDNANQITTRNNAAILMDGCQYWTVYGNYIYNSPRRAIASSDNDGTELAKNHHLDIQYNIIRDWDRNQEGYSLNVGVFISARGNDEGSGYDKIENNTIYASENRSFVGINVPLRDPAVDFMRNISIRNNIVYLANNKQTDSFAIRLNRSKDNFPGALVDNNLVYGPPNLYEYDGVPFTSTSSFYKVSGYSQHDVNLNPQFVNANYSQPSGFMLQSASPAINVGASVGLTMDYAGTSVPQPPGSTPDIGAYEYVGTAPPTYKAEDINQDGTVNTQDLQACANQIFGTQSWSRADVNNDGKYDVKDLQRIANVILGV